MAAVGEAGVSRAGAGRLRRTSPALLDHCGIRVVGLVNWATTRDLPPLNGTACRERHGEKAQRRRPVNFQPSSSFDTTWHRVATLQSALWTGVGS